jgi:hypothetical protein
MNIQYEYKHKKESSLIPKIYSKLVLFIKNNTFPLLMNNGIDNVKNNDDDNANDKGDKKVIIKTRHKVYQ